MDIYCCGCGKGTRARLTNGVEIYPHRSDLSSLPFWRCDTCGNYVGCHHKTKQPKRPLGVIPTPEMRNARKHIHAIMDVFWQNGAIERKKLYRKLSKFVGREFHTADIRTIEEARKIYKRIEEIALHLETL